MKRSTSRIVSLLPSATEIVCALGLQDRLVGLSHECNWPPGIADKPRVTRSNVDSAASSGQIDQQVKTLMQSGQALYEVDEARLVSLEPDLIITQAQCDVCAVSYDSVVGIVTNSIGLQGTQVLATNPASLADVFDDVESIAKAAGAWSAGSAYRQSLQQRINVVVERAAGRPARPRTIVIEWTEPLMVAGNWTPGMVELAGGSYVLAKAGEHSRYVSWEELIDYQPQVVVVAPCGFDLARSNDELEMLRQLPQWDELAAQQVCVADGDAFFNRPGPRLVDSVEMLSQWIDGAVC